MQSSNKAGKVYALLISVGNYEEFKIADLKSSRKDLQLMEEALKNGLKVLPDNIRIIGENGTATIISMAHAMKDFSRMLKKEDTFLFYFSGHGKDGKLIFSDNVIGLQSVIAYMEKLPAKNKIVILDCCYAGNFSEVNPKKICLGDSIDSFVGAGMAVMASSSANEQSRLGPGGNHSLFTGMVATAFCSRQLIRRGKISLEAIIEYTRALMDFWNQQHPDKVQQPVIRTSIGGTISFDVEDYRPYETKQVCFETPEYRVCSVKPLSSRQEKRLCAFVIPKNKDFADSIPAMTKDIARRIRYENVFSNRKNEVFFRNQSAKAIWCYFGKDDSDIINSLHYAYSAWASDRKTANKYFQLNQNASVKEGIYVYRNPSYETLRAMREDNIKMEEYENDVRKLFYKIIDRAEQYISCITEVYNRTKDFEEAQMEYTPWMKEVFGLYYRLTDAPIAPDQLHDWVEAVMAMAGWVIDMTLILKESKKNDFDDRNRWLFQNAKGKYYESLERIRELEEGNK